MQLTKITVGVDIGGTNTAFGVIDENNNVLYKDIFPTNPGSGINEFFDRLINQIGKFYNNNNRGFILDGIGVAAPGANSLTGRIESPANLKWGNVNIVEMLKTHFSVPVELINDANAAALGEYSFGTAKGMKNFVVLTIGTGLGSGIFIDGQLVLGQNGIAGEMGHITIDPQGRLCGCGRRGCIETYVSATGLCRTMTDLVSQSLSSTENNYSYITAEKINLFAMQGDSLALQAFNITGEYLGRMLTNIAAAFDPEAIILAGGLVKSGDLLIKPAVQFFNENVLYSEKREIKILRSLFNDGEGAFLGASCLVRQSPPTAIVAEESSSGKNLTADQV